MALPSKVPSWPPSAHGELLPSITVPQLVNEIFAATVEAYPDRTAIIDGSIALTYAELNLQAHKLATTLRAHGVGPRTYVAIWMPRTHNAYLAILAVLKAGAAYVPLDADWPQERVLQVLRDSHASMMLCDEQRCAMPVAWPCPVRSTNGPWQTEQPAELVPMPDANEPCYVIYTSGSTGVPKGVPISHASVAHLAFAEQHLYGVRSDDRVLAGFSLAFDAAVEEIWLAFASGATLVVAPRESLLEDVGGFINTHKITVFSTVPTLLSAVQGDLATVRILILGGEACPQALADRWAVANRKMFNTYGPTEATVITTCAQLAAGRPVNIGKPIPNYYTYIVDDHGQLARPGEAGELMIGGIGLSRGYLNNAALTAERFIENCLTSDTRAPRILYRTGDLVRYDELGNIEFLGRIDDQVKLRGFRIELGEIASALLRESGVSQAAATLWNEEPRRIIAYVVLRPQATFDAQACLANLRERLPVYMVPAQIEILAAMPTLTSGKINRKAFPPPKSPTAGVTESKEPPRGRLEQLIANRWESLLKGAKVGRNDDFFLDLGGHSMLVAQLVSCLRKEPEFTAISIRDVYERPTVAGLAQVYNTIHTENTASIAAQSISPRRHKACALAQMFGLYLVIGVFSLEWLAPFLAYDLLCERGFAVLAALIVAAGVVLISGPALLLVALLAKWTIVGRYRAGRFPLWGSYYFRCWLVRRLLDIAPTSILAGTPLLGSYYRLLGAHLGKNVHLASDNLECFDLIYVGDDATVGIDASLRGCTAENGDWVLGAIHVGQRAVIGARCLLEFGSNIGDDAEVAPLTCLPSGGVVPANELWGGSPARHLGIAEVKPVVRASRGMAIALAFAYTFLSLLLPMVFITAFLPGLATLYYFERHLGNWFWVATPLVSCMFVLVLCVEIVIVKRVLFHQVTAGEYPLNSFLCLRKWIFDQTMTMSLDLLGGLYATLYLNPWLRSLGVNLGKNVEVSTASSMIPNLLHINDEAFVADAVSIGAPRIARGILSVKSTYVGRRSFIGNSAVVPSGVQIGDDCLVGCLSLAPQGADVSTVKDASWFGSPPISLPRRQLSSDHNIETTYSPSRSLVLQRYAIEALRVTLPTTCTVIFTCALLRTAAHLNINLSWGQLTALFPAIYAALCLAVWAVVIALKWSLMGRYRAGEKPLWNNFVWRTELVTAMHENFADPLINEMLRGTPYLAWFFRALGTRIGKRVYMETTQITEYDLVSIGKDVSLNNDCTLQTHLFEDRVMKMSTVCVDDRCTVGEDAVVLYDSVMEAGAQLGALSLLMKGEHLPPDTRWEGSPSRATTMVRPASKSPSPASGPHSTESQLAK